MFHTNKWLNRLPVILAVLVYIVGWFIDVMQEDAAQYASISQEMMEKNSYLLIKHRGLDYLDKPPLLFWLTSISFKIFGVHNFSYKLPSFLFSLLAIYSTFRLTALQYKREIAVLAAVILATTQAFFLMNNDVRTDLMLTGSVVFATWQLNAYIKNNNIKRLILGAIGLGLALLSKGPIGAIIPLMALLPDLFIRRTGIEALLRIQWLLIIPIVAVMLIPMSYGLFLQFGYTGLKFFYWTQSFGRITGESVWKNDADFTFLWHSTLWAFLPWSMFLLAAIVKRFNRMINYDFNSWRKYETISLSGFLLPMIALSLSKYQLPHYAFVTYPFAAMLTAKFIYDLYHEKEYSKYKKWMLPVQLVISLLLWIIPFLLFFICFPEHKWFNLVLFILLFGVFLYLFFVSDFAYKIVVTSAFTACSANFLMNSHIYPELLKYQLAGKAGQYIRDHQLPHDRFFTFKSGSEQALEFYSGGFVPSYDRVEDLKQVKRPLWLYTSEAGINELNNRLIKYEVLIAGQDYHITLLTLPFLDPGTRSITTEKKFLVKVLN